MSPLKLWPSETEDNTHVDFLTVLGTHWLSCPPYTFFMRRGEKGVSNCRHQLSKWFAQYSGPQRFSFACPSPVGLCSLWLFSPLVGPCSTALLLPWWMSNTCHFHTQHFSHASCTQRRRPRSSEKPQHIRKTDRQAPKQSSGRPKSTRDGLFMHVPWQDRGLLGYLLRTSQSSWFYSRHHFSASIFLQGWPTSEGAAWRAPPHPGILPGVSNTCVPSHTSAFRSSHPHSRYPQDCAAHSGFKIKSQVPDFSETVLNAFLVVFFIMWASRDR